MRGVAGMKRKFKVFVWALAMGLVCPRIALADPMSSVGINIQTRDSNAAAVLSDALAETYWQGASLYDYSNRLYDEIRMLRTDNGHVSMISGEGDRNFDLEKVGQAILTKQGQLPRHEDGAMAVELLGQGIDSTNGLPYTDVFFYLDMSFFYATYTQRMYYLRVPDGRIIIYFEEVQSDFVGPDVWEEYQQKIRTVSEAVDRRWPPFDSVVPVDDIFGMFIVSAGETRSVRVTFVTKLAFGDDASWVARWGSELPLIIRMGLQSGFNACVAIASQDP